MHRTRFSQAYRIATLALVLASLILSLDPTYAAQGRAEVVYHWPGADAVNVPTTSTIQVTWSRPMAPDTEFLIVGPSGAVDGLYEYGPEKYTVNFRPARHLMPGTFYTVVVNGQKDAEGQAQALPFQWSFTTVSPTSVTLSEFNGKPGIQQAWWWGAWPWLMIIFSTLSLLGFLRVWRSATVSSADKLP